MKSTSEHVIIASDHIGSSFKWIAQAQGAGTSSPAIASVFIWLIPEFGYCLVISLYQKTTRRRWHTLCTAVHEISVNLWFATSVCSFFQLLGIFPFRNLLQLQPIWTSYFTITQLLSCCWADRPKSCMSESVLGTGLMLHTVALGTVEGKVQCPAEGGCCLMPVWRWGGGCWLMCRRASRR